MLTKTHKRQRILTTGLVLSTILLDEATVEVLRTLCDGLERDSTKGNRRILTDTVVDSLDLGENHGEGFLLKTGVLVIQTAAHGIERTGTGSLGHLIDVDESAWFLVRFRIDLFVFVGSRSSSDLGRHSVGYRCVLWDFVTFRNGTFWGFANEIFKFLRNR